MFTNAHPAYAFTHTKLFFLCQTTDIDLCLEDTSQVLRIYQGYSFWVQFSISDHITLFVFVLHGV